MEKKTHYAPSGEWGQTRTTCNRYYTCDVLITGNKEDVTCEHCLESISN